MAWHPHLSLEVQAMFRSLSGRADEQYEVYVQARREARREQFRRWYWLHSREPREVLATSIHNQTMCQARKTDSVKWEAHKADSRRRHRDKQSQVVAERGVERRTCPTCNESYVVDPRSNGRGRRVYCTSKCRLKANNNKAYAKVKAKRLALEREP